uniref:Uncharacterized protein n=1 Tax=Oryza brachyantha TaxID=4533 RepID=J3M7W7_ORYBR
MTNWTIGAPPLFWPNYFKKSNRSIIKMHYKYKRLYQLTCGPQIFAHSFSQKDTVYLSLSCEHKISDTMSPNPGSPTY